MKKLKQFLMITLAALLLCSIAGCSNRYLENRRIYKKAGRTAQKQAVAFIKDKYGIAATPLGYDIQGDSGSFTWSAKPEVLVKLAYRDKIFYASVNIDKKGKSSDNYESEAFGNIFKNYLLSTYGLPSPKQFDVSFRMSDAKDYLFSKPGSAEAVTNMVTFKFENQPAEELLRLADSITYSLQYTEQHFPLHGITLNPKDWPSHKGFRATLNICRYNDEKSCSAYHQKYPPSLLWGGHPQPWTYQYLKEWSTSSIQYSLYDEAGKPEQSNAYYAFQSASIDGFNFITTLPDPPENMVRVSDKRRVWQKTDAIGNEIHVKEYEQIGNLYELTAAKESPDFRVLMVIPDAYMRRQQGNDLFFGTYKMSEGTFYTTMIYPDGPEEGTDPSRVEASRSLCMFPNEQYAILKLTSQYVIPSSSSPDT